MPTPKDEKFGPVETAKPFGLLIRHSNRFERSRNGICLPDFMDIVITDMLRMPKTLFKSIIYDAANDPHPRCDLWSTAGFSMRVSLQGGG